MSRLFFVVLVLFCFYNYGNSQSPCDQCVQALIELNDSLEIKLNTIKIYEQRLNYTNKELSKMKILVDSLGLNYKEIGKNNNYTIDIPYVSRDDSNVNSSIDSLIYLEYLAKIEVLEKAINELDNVLASQYIKIENLINSLDSIKQENNLLVNTLESKKQLIVKLDKEIVDLGQKLTSIQSILNCVKSFASEQKTIRREAESKLKEARQLYETIYPTYKRDKRKQYDIESIIDSVVNIYLEYQTTNKTMQCESIEDLEYSFDNLTHIDDYYLMRIYAFNEGNVVDKLNAMEADGNGRQKSVSLALSHLGKVMEKGNYDDKKLDDHIITELFEVMNNLGFYIIPSKTKNSDQVALEKVIEYYNKGKYDAALSQYNKYERYISSSNTSLPSAKIQEIQFKIASIVIWQLAPISRDRSIYPKSSWLYRISGNPVQEGLQILHELMSTEDLDPEVRRDCIITKTKMYA